MSDELTTRLKSDNPRKGNKGMTTQPKFEGYKYTDRDGALIDVHPYRTSRGLMVSVTTHAKGNEPGGEIVWIPPEEAPALAQAILDSAAARAFTDPEPEPEPLEVRKLGSCYLVDGFHVCCGELNRTADDTRSAIEDAERKLAVLKFQLAEQEKAGQEQKAAAMKKRLDDLSTWFLGRSYSRATGGEKRAIDRIVELEDGK